ncbi:hypothetical protein ANN_00688 [Periplaneta americana]|uniref:Per a allergen n=1 Tax=Periplaneta americana TaxID=6978 RepID=A0ABQ8TRI8_PERAM|nr:hypothetical protein ANN_00688 [Periplaneta americana]
MAGLCEGGNEPPSSLKAMKNGITTCEMNASFIMEDDGDWAPVQEKFGEVNMEDFVSVDNSLVTAEIRGVDNMIADLAATTV